MIRNMKSFRWWPVLGVAAAALALSACGGGGGSSSDVSVRLVNATLTHPSLDLWINSAVAATAIASDGVSAYVAATPASGGTVALQIDDAGSATALNTQTPAVVEGGHYAVLAYESRGSVSSVLVSEDWPVPASGATTLRVSDAAIEAGKLDVYVTTNPVAGAADLAAISPVGTFLASATQAVISLTYSPGSYYVTVTGSGNPVDVRLQNMPVTLANQQVAAVVLTPAAGGELLNGSLLIQQGAYSTLRNTSTRVRLASAVSGNAVVAAAAAGPASTVNIDPGSVAPALDSYVLVPAGSALNISVNGASIAAPGTALIAGGDMTLLVYGTPGNAVASLLADDNRPATDPSAVKIRLINGITGNAANALTLTANSATVASNIAPGAAAPYTAVASSLNPMNLSLYSSQKAGVYFSTNSYVLNAGSVYTVLGGGDFAAPLLLVR